MFKKALILSFLSIVYSGSLLAQKSFDETSEYNFMDRVYFGGGGGFSAGTNYTAINVSPIVGYMFTNRFSSGLGVIYQYINYKNVGLKTSNYGGSIFSRFNISQQFFLHTEYEGLNFETFNVVGGEVRTERIYSPSLFLGGGYFQPLGARSGVSFMLLYNLIYDRDKSSYPQPYVIRVGFSL